jgi:hypothetical protein
MDRHVVISSDTDAAAGRLEYRPCTESKCCSVFDDRAVRYVNSFSDLLQKDAARNWDSGRRMRDF